jgi:hypothetical protein
MGERVHGLAGEQYKVLTQLSPVFVVGRMDLLFRCAVHPVNKIHIDWWIFRQQELHIIDVHMHAVPEGRIWVSQHITTLNDYNLPAPVPLHYC